jgi:hypothetical protein
VREAVLTNLWLTALNQLQPVRCPRQAELAPQTACLIKAGTLLNIWLLPSRDARVIASARVEALCAGFTAGPED